MTPLRIAVSSLVVAALSTIAVAQAQVAPVPYSAPSGPFGVGLQSSGDIAPALDEDGNPKGFSFRSFDLPVTAFGSGLSYTALGTANLVATGGQYGYSFKGLGNTPVTLFGGVNALRTAPDVFTSLVTPGFERSSTLATGVNAGIAFQPTSNLTLSLSGSFVQSAPTQATDLRSQLIQSYR